MIPVQLSDRVKHLPPYLFAAIDKMKQDALAKGIDLIDLSIGDPDIPTPKHIVDAMKKAVENSAHHRYPSYEGMLFTEMQLQVGIKKIQCLIKSKDRSIIPYRL